MNSKKAKGLRKLARLAMSQNNPLTLKETYKMMKGKYNMFKQNPNAKTK